MPVHSKRLTESVARSIPAPPKSYEIHWCPRTPGFGLRVTAAGARAWIAERRVDGKTIRRTLGKAAGAAAISADTARSLQLDVSSELQNGQDRLEVKREKRKAEKVEALTLDAAVRAYVKNKRRTKDGLPLKARTRSDYLAMVAPAGVSKTGRATLPGMLHGLSVKSLHRITGDDIRRLYAALEPRGERRRAYALQVLRAVLRHEGVTIEGDPLSPTTAGASRVRLPATKGNPTPIPPERLGAWWKAAGAMATLGADQLKFQLLTGCRPGEAAGIVVGDFDLKGERVLLRDTKNRADHTLVLSKQAAAIAHWHAQGKKPKDVLFGVGDAGKSLDLINAASEVEGITAHKLRHTFASIAAELVPTFTLRRMMNHAGGADTAAVHYVHVSDAQLRTGWQAVADFIEAAK
jgi:integrase